jgi:Xaa-Pro dipeptidase
MIVTSRVEGRRMEMVPKEEIEGRIDRFQSKLEQQNLDGAFIMQNADLFYFSGTIQKSVLFIPRNNEPLLMVMKSCQRAMDESPLKQIIPVKDIRETFSIIRDYGYSEVAALGLEMDVLPANYYLWFQKSLPESRWLDVSDQIRRIRMIKSPYEVAQIERAAVILDKGLRGITKIIAEGVTELEVDGYLNLMARREGHMGILRMRGFNKEMTYAHVLSGETGSTVSLCDTATGGTGTTPAMAQGAGFRRIKRNEPIGIDYGVGINGYLGDEFRTYVIGALSSHLEKVYDTARYILELLVREAKPGITCSYLYLLAEKEAERYGYEDFFMGHGEGKVKFIGHGIGLEIDEYPIFSPYSADKLEEGMVIALEPKFILPGQGIVGLEDDYVITSSGLRRLTLTDQGVMRIP